MPPVRITPTTATAVTRQLTAELVKWIREAQPLAAAPTLAQDAEAVDAACRGRALSVEVAVASAAADAESIAEVLRVSGCDGEAGRISDAIAAGQPVTERCGTALGELTLEFTRLLRPRAHPAGRLHMPVLLVVTRGGVTDDELLQLESLAEERPLAIHLPLGADAENVDGVLNQSAWHARRLAPDGQTAAGSMLASPVADAGDLLRAHSAARAVESLVDVFALAIEQELKSLRTRRAIVQQKVARSQQPSPSTPQEIVNEVRTLVQRQFGDFERGVADRLTEALMPQSGAVAVMLEHELAEMPDLDEEIGMRSITLRVSRDYQEQLVERLGQTLAEHFATDARALDDLFRLLATEIDRTLQKSGGPPAVVTFQHLTDERSEKALRASLFLERQYQGELPKKGFFEYAMVARRYQVLVYMIFSTFGLSFLRSYREFMIPLSILLLAGGGLTVASSVRRERVESRRREQDKAREQLRGEIKRILAAVQREWLSIVSQHLSSQTPLIVQQVEGVFRDFHARRSSEATDERQRLQRQMQGFEARERRLLPIGKGRDQLAASVAQLRGELRQLTVATLRGQKVSA